METSSPEMSYESDSTSIPKNGQVPKKNAGGFASLGVGVFEDRRQNIKSDMRAEKRKELNEQLAKAESDVATDIRVLRGAIRKQDDNHLLLRRAYQGP